MKWFVILWAGPIAFLGAWYGLSYHDISFGFFMLTRETHDLVFEIYGNILGMEPDAIPPLVARALIVDTLLVIAILVFRRRRVIAAWWKSRRAYDPAVVSRDSDASLSSAP
ncbi:DUF6105 family protein [Pararhizobium haloflavum]|uniref:DUF6105 family protein n=1 Tax=Pararhizobium haloflavum TaxID=2037914 RepID=UPI000C17D514|nr:DUF6105 family protein [Pararhizobium haloflavum]